MPEITLTNIERVYLQVDRYREQVIDLIDRENIIAAYKVIWAAHVFIRQFPQHIQSRLFKELGFNDYV